MESVAQMFAGFAVAAFSLTLAWLVGNTLAARLEREKKLTERDVAALTSFQEIYGEFYSVWKEWGNSARDPATATRLLALAARVEGKYEALFPAGRRMTHPAGLQRWRKNARQRTCRRSTRQPGAGTAR